MFERSGYHFFTFRGIDVSVSPWYLILMAFFAFWPMLNAGSGMMGEAFVSGLVFIVAITGSLLIHEFGHAFAAKFYRLEPSVLLHGFGGLCMHRPASSDKDDALVVFAGPGVELIFAGLVILFSFFVLPGLDLGVAGPMVAELVSVLIWFNLVWGLLNLLLPIWPLDGGQLFHLLLRRFMPENRARDLALKVSIFVLIPVGILGFWKLGSFFIAILALYILMDNVQALNDGRDLVGRASGARAARAPASAFQTELLQDAEQALDAGDYREAYRVCHQMRSTGDMPDKMLSRVWEILALTAVEMERFEEAESYLKRAPDTAALRRARQIVQSQPG
jgi:Zn-dependent protease